VDVDSLPVLDLGTVKHRPAVYFARSRGLVKIGFTRQLSDRLRALEREARAPVELIAAGPGGRQREQDLHGRLAAFSVGREWFTPSAELLEWMDHASRNTSRWRALASEAGPATAKEIAAWGREARLNIIARHLPALTSEELDAVEDIINTSAWATAHRATRAA
jgi:hypothetical protein